MTAVQAQRGHALTGFVNQARRESASWWTTRRWVVNAVVWASVVNGLVALMLWVVPNLEGGPAEVATMDLLEVAVQFTGLAAIVAGAGVVLTSQGLLLDDLRAGLVEWLLSKPLARPALILAKFAGHAPALVVVLVVFPWLGVYAQLSLAAGEAWPVGRWVGAVAIVGLLVLFQLAVVLLLSTLTASRSAVLALPLAALVGADLFVSFVPGAAEWLPWGLGPVAGVMLALGELASTQLLVVAGLATLACLVAAAWRFERGEL